MALYDALLSTDIRSSIAATRPLAFTWPMRGDGSPEGQAWLVSPPRKDTWTQLLRSIQLWPPNPPLYSYRDIVR